MSCSTDDKEEQEICCQHPVQEILDHINTEYPRILSNENLSDEQRSEIEEEYEKALEDPCEYFKKSLESAGATCEGAH